MSTYDASPAALRPLLETFWSPQGWREPPEMPAGEAMEQAVEAGVMFAEPTELDHDGWVAAAREAVAATKLEDVEEAFVASLTSRRLDLRSALGSYAVARHLPNHPFEPGSSSRCAVCGLHRSAVQDLNVLSFERFKWGGARRDDLRYLMFDLEQFERAPRLPLTPEAVQVGRDLLDGLRQAGPTETAPSMASGLRMVKGNKAEREVLLDILGVCGVLEVGEHQGYLDWFVPFGERESPPQRYVDRSYPVCWWRGADGVNDAAVQALLPSLG